MKKLSDIHKKNISLALKGKSTGKMTQSHKKVWLKSIKKSLNKRHLQTYKEFKEKWKKISKIEWAWLAGFWEGEGHIAHRKLKFGKDYRMSITQKDILILLYIQKLLETGNIYSQNKEQKFFCYSYRISKLAVSRLFMEKIFFLLKSERRKKQVSEALNDFCFKGTHSRNKFKIGESNG